jgi:peptidoglycan/xylan/chitin deacetylase (PgdA/CDA1 family)
VPAVAPSTPVPSSAAPGRSAPPPAPADDRSPGLRSARLTTGSTTVALTFDDGPDPVNTPKLLDLLRARRVKATFCLVGQRVRTYPAIVARIAAEGHTLCNHSWQHLEKLYRHDDGAIRRDLQRTTAQIRRAVPGARVDYFRAPYGNFTSRLTAIAGKLGMIALGWNVDDQCYRTADFGAGREMVDRMVRRVELQVRPGSVVLGHDLSKPQTIVAYRRLLPWLTSRFRVVAMPVVSSRPGAPSASAAPAVAR